VTRACSGRPCGATLDSIGGGGGCILDVASCISSTPWRGGISDKGESRAVLDTYFGVSGSDDGGETYEPGSTPSMGNVWLRGRWKLLAVTGGILACDMNGDAESGEKKGDVGLVIPGENEDDVASKSLDRDSLLMDRYGPP